jgi:hypothetical protein
MCLQNLPNLFFTNVTAIKQAIKGFCERLMTSWALISLMTVGHLAMFMSLDVTT